MQVTEIDITDKIGEMGSYIIRRAFEVVRDGRSPHVVTFEFSHSGAPQERTCDCDGYKYRGNCSHIDAVWAAEDIEFPCYYED